MDKQAYDPKKRRARYLKGRAGELAYQKARYAADPEPQKARARKFYTDNTAKRKAQTMAWRRAHPEEYKTYMRELMRRRRG